MHRRRLTAGEWALFATPLLALLMALFVGSGPLSWRFRFLDPRGKTRLSSCQTNLKQIGLGMAMYSQDYNSKFPPAKIGGLRPVTILPAWDLKPPVGWVDALVPYTRNTTNYFCPASTNPLSLGPTTIFSTHYYFNGNLSASPLTKIKQPAATLLIGDGNDGREVADGTYSKISMPPQWLNDYNSPAYRHLGGANYGFADGHVKWLRPHDISAVPGAKYTFSTR